MVTFYSPLKRLVPDSSSLAPELGNDVAITNDIADDALATFAIPFGPFIALSALEWLTFEPWLMALFRQYIFAP